jgi:glutathione S-transferase
VILYHGAPNIFSLKALIALEELGLDYVSRPIEQVPLEQAVPGYPSVVEHRITQEREGPVLVNREAVIAGSFFLLEYLADAFPEAELVPADALGRYRTQAIGQTVSNLIAPFVVELGFARYPVPAGDFDAVEPSERRQAWQAAHAGSDVSGHDERLMPTLARFEAMLEDAGGEWLLARYSIADIDLFAMIRNLPDIAPGLLDGLSGLCAFITRMEARPAVRRALAKGEAGAERVFTPGPEIARWG